MGQQGLLGKLSPSFEFEAESCIENPNLFPFSLNKETRRTKDVD
jgi:hypothetical protein